MAEWQSGYAWDCKSHYLGSIPGFRLQIQRSTTSTLNTLSIPFQATD